MSTFDGKVIEFPDIRIDHFRVAQSESRKPLAFFLSHVHSDHLAGLETCKSPFIYCSPATREILLRLEKYPHRMNFTKGILEARKQTYRHLKNLLKPIPLETTTTLELAPGRHIRVTLFDANHCTGAVTFLIEDDHHAVMYTGDVRSEQWWVDYMVRHPLLLPYAAHAEFPPFKKLDCLYLDTTFASDQPQCKHFVSKRDGILELLMTVAKYPSDTIFYFNSWTFGYEDVWEALSTFLRSKVHVDDYRFGLYSALSRATGLKPEEAYRLIGFYCGNHFQEGCLTRTQTRLHSCEYGTGCNVFEQDHVRITPIIGRYKGQDIPELGAGGGHGDLGQQHELELGDQSTIQQLIMLCRSKLERAPSLLEAVDALLQTTLDSTTSMTTIPLDASVLQKDASQSGDDISSFYDLPIENLVPAIVAFVQKKQEDKQGGQQHEQDLRPDGLPKRISFPYSRHSSLDELSHLVESFQPVEIHPCTVDYAHWSVVDSMSHLFGPLYPQGKTFRHDDMMRQRSSKRSLLEDMMEASRKRVQHDQLSTAPVLGSPFQSPQTCRRGAEQTRGDSAAANGSRTEVSIAALHAPSIPQPAIRRSETADTQILDALGTIRDPDDLRPPSDVYRRAQDHKAPSTINTIDPPDTGRVRPLQITDESPNATPEPKFTQLPTGDHVTRALRMEAYAAALGRGTLAWDELNLISVGKDAEDQEL